jgi:hypothetical protein
MLADSRAFPIMDFVEDVYLSGGGKAWRLLCLINRPKFKLFANIESDLSSRKERIAKKRNMRTYWRCPGRDQWKNLLNLA